MSARPGYAQASHKAAKPALNGSWLELAICRGDSADFVSDDKLEIAIAKSVCLECPVIKQCREWAIEHDEQGVWGGLDDDDRRKLGRTKPKKPKPRVTLQCQCCGQPFEAASNKSWYCAGCRKAARRASWTKYDTKQREQS